MAEEGAVMGDKLREALRKTADSLKDYMKLASDQECVQFGAFGHAKDALADAEALLAEPPVPPSLSAGILKCPCCSLELGVNMHLHRIVCFVGAVKPAQLNQRLWDLVRHQRSELHEAELITDDEYAELAKDHAAVKRLEDYDTARRREAEIRYRVLEEAAQLFEKYGEVYETEIAMIRALKIPAKPVLRLHTGIDSLQQADRFLKAHCYIFNYAGKGDISDGMANAVKQLIDTYEFQLREKDARMNEEIAKTLAMRVELSKALSLKSQVSVTGASHDK